MHTFEKDGFALHYYAVDSGKVCLGRTGQPFSICLPPGFLQAWLDHAGYVLVPKESMAGDIASILANYDGDRVMRGLQEFLDECDKADSEELRRPDPKFIGKVTCKVVKVEDRRIPRATKDDSEEGE